MWGPHCNVPVCGFLHVYCALGLMSFLTDGFTVSSTSDSFGRAVPNLASLF